MTSWQWGPNGVLVILGITDVSGPQRPTAGHPQGKEKDEGEGPRGREGQERFPSRSPSPYVSARQPATSLKPFIQDRKEHRS